MLTTDTQMIEDTPAQHTVRAQATAQKILSAAAQLAESSGVKYTTIHLEHEHPYRAIIDTAQAETCGLIIMASHGRRGISALVLGSETMKVLTHCQIPVLVHR